MIRDNVTLYGQRNMLRTAITPVGDMVGGNPVSVGAAVEATAATVTLSGVTTASGQQFTRVDGASTLTQVTWATNHVIIREQAAGSTITTVNRNDIPAGSSGASIAVSGGLANLTVIGGVFLSQSATFARAVNSSIPAPATNLSCMIQGNHTFTFTGVVGRTYVVCSGISGSNDFGGQRPFGSNFQLTAALGAAGALTLTNATSLSTLVQGPMRTTVISCTASGTVTCTTPFFMAGSVIPSGSAMSHTDIEIYPINTVTEIIP